MTRSTVATMLGLTHCTEGQKEEQEKKKAATLRCAPFKALTQAGTRGKSRRQRAPSKKGSTTRVNTSKLSPEQPAKGCSKSDHQLAIASSAFQNTNEKLTLSRAN